MNAPRFYVDFNEMLEPDLVLLAQHDQKADSAGNLVSLFEGLPVAVYSDDKDAHGQIDNLVASGIVGKNTHTDGWSRAAKWLCRISEPGIRHESETHSS